MADEYLNKLYFQDAFHFQRMVAFLISQRFQHVRVYLPKKQRDETMCFTLEGTLIDYNQGKREFRTFTDWYNTAMNASFAEGDIEVLKEIYISKLVSVHRFLKSLPQEKMHTFLDIPYRSNCAYSWIVKRLRQLEIPFVLNQEFRIQWKEKIYIVSTEDTVCEEGGPIRNFLDNVSKSEPMDLLLLTYEDPVSLTKTLPSSPPAPTPPSEISPPPSLIQEFQTLKTFLQTQLDLSNATLNVQKVEWKQALQERDSEINLLKEELRVLRSLHEHQSHMIQSMFQQIAQVAQASQFAQPPQPQPQQPLIRYVPAFQYPPIQQM